MNGPSFFMQVTITVRPEGGAMTGAWAAGLGFAGGTIGLCPWSSRDRRSSAASASSVSLLTSAAISALGEAMEAARCEAATR